MSYYDRNVRYSHTQSCAYWDTEMTGELRSVLGALGTFNNDDSHWCWPSQQTLADMLGTDQAHISRAVNRLGELGYIEIQRTHARSRCKYRFIMDLRLPPERVRKPHSPQPSCAREYAPEAYRSMPQRHTEYASGAYKRTYRTDPINDPLFCAPQAATREGESQATSQPSRADPKRVALTAALARYPQHFGMPRSRSELTLWNKRITSLLEGGLTPADVPRAVNAWKRKYPSAQLTINALDNRLGELLPAPIPTPTPAPQAQEESHDEPAPDTATRQPIPIRTQEEVERERAEADERRRAATQRARAALVEANRRATDAKVVSRGARLAAAPRAPLQM